MSRLDELVGIHTKIVGIQLLITYIMRVGLSGLEIRLFDLQVNVLYANKYKYLVAFW